MNKEFLETLIKSHRQCPDCPSPEVISQFFLDVLGALFPDHCPVKFKDDQALTKHLTALKQQLENLIIKSPENRQVNDVHQVVNSFFEELPIIYHKLHLDVAAMFEGDPAATSEREIIRTYPGFYAIAAYRIAHVLLGLNIAGIPRVITEHAHSKTGIDIHPGAKIGNHFCIDHGTGIVIGETVVIGNHVKLYQGVTLGALSINKEDALKKRHPTIEDNVVIYSGATILGGNTVVGAGSIIGGNVWITRSVAPHTKIYYQPSGQNEDATPDFITMKISEP